ncbi:MAG: putative 26S proteasome regulatory subunit [Geoglossum simile]|nr:MAG: putative 26S proteasome regulatory subunit [Geoglossum simile]
MDSTSVPSGPSSWHGTDGSDYGALTLMQLLEKKKVTESELKQLSGVLKTNGVDMSTPLLTVDGFPRMDIDVAQIRSARNRIIHIRNDYKIIMQLLESMLHDIHARTISTVTSRAPINELDSVAPITSPNEPAVPAIETPFAKISNVVAGSPAEEASLRLDDQIRKFGNVTWLNHEKLSRVRITVQNSEGQTVIVKVVRKGTPDEELELKLKPRRGWGGSGLLGCTLVPL